MNFIDSLKELNKELHNDLEKIRINTTKIQTDRIHLHFTDHSINHSNRILEKLEGIMSDFMKSEFVLNEYELFILCSAIYLHDIGMQHELNAELKKLLNINSDEEIPDELTFVRMNHGKISRIWIEQNIQNSTSFRDAYSGNKRLGEFVALIVESHNVNIKENLHLYQDTIYSGKKIRMAFLAAMLSIGDVLDLDFNRIDYERLKHKSVPLDSKLHWFKHYYVEGSIFDKNALTISYCFPSSLDKEQLEYYKYFFCTQTQYWIEKLQKDLQEIFTENKIYFPINEHVTSSISKEKLDDEIFIEIVKFYKSKKISLQEKIRMRVAKDLSIFDVQVNLKGEIVIIKTPCKLLTIEKKEFDRPEGMDKLIENIKN